MLRASCIVFPMYSCSLGKDKPLEQTALTTPPSRDHDHAMRNTAHGV